LLQKINQTMDMELTQKLGRARRWAHTANMHPPNVPFCQSRCLLPAAEILNPHWWLASLFLPPF